MIQPYLFMVAASAALSAAGVKVRRVRERRRVRARLRAIPEAAAEIAEGTEVRVTGVVRVLDEELVAPLTGRPCVLYRVSGMAGGLFAMKQWRAKLATGNRPHETFAIVPFVIDRGAAGLVVVDGPAADVDLPAIPRKAQDPERVRGYPLVHGLGHRERRRFDEIAVAVGDTVTVVGRAMLDAAPAPAAHEVGFRDGAPPRLRVTGSRARPLTISRGS